MEDPSGVHGARTTLAIAFAIITALVALLWVIPKTPGGGFWLFTLPAAILFPVFSYAVVAPGTRKRTTGVAWAMVSILVVLYFGGMLISSLAFGDRVLIGAAETMQSLTVRWRSLGIAALVIVGILKLLERSSSKKQAGAAPTPRPEPASDEPAPASARASAQADGGIPAGSIPPSPLVPTQPMTQPARQQAVIRLTTVERPAAMPAPAPLTRPAHTPPVPGSFPQVSTSERPSAIDPAPAPPPRREDRHGLRGIVRGAHGPRRGRHQPQRAQLGDLAPAQRHADGAGTRRGRHGDRHRGRDLERCGAAPRTTLRPRDARGALELLPIAGDPQRPIPPRRRDCRRGPRRQERATLRTLRSARMTSPQPRRASTLPASPQPRRPQEASP